MDEPGYDPVAEAEAAAKESAGEARSTAAKALNLALAGVDWDTIADKLGYDDAADALLAAGEIADAQYGGIVHDPQRLIEVLRLDRLQAAVWSNAMKGDIAAVSTALSIGDRRVRLLRLNQRSKE